MTGVRLRFAAEPVTDKVTAGRLPHVDLSDVGSGASGTFTPRESVDRDTEALVLQPGQAAYGRLRPYLRKTFLADRQMTCSTEFLVLEAREDWHPRFLAYCLRSNEFALAVGGLVEGAKMPRVSWADVRNLRVQQRATADQERIADFLDRECGRLEEISAAWDLQRGAFDEFRASVIQDEARGLRHVPLKRAASVIDCKHRTPDYTASGLPLISTREVTRGELVIDETTRRVSDDDFADLREAGRDPRRGDLIYSRNASVGVAAVVPHGSEICMGQDVVLITRRPRHCRLLALVLNWAIDDQVERFSLGSTFSRINVPTIRELIVPDDAPEREDAVLDRLHRRFQALDELETTLDRQDRALAGYRDALITEAVTGKLDVTRLSEQQLDESARAAIEGERREVLSA